jgi:hypothetical protein
MGVPLIQTQDAISALKACGLRRKEFQVRCERLMRGRQFIGYGDVQIILWCPLARQHELAPNLAEHFQVEMFMDGGSPRGCLLIGEAKGKPGLRLREWNENV